MINLNDGLARAMLFTTVALIALVVVHILIRQIGAML